MAYHLFPALTDQAQFTVVLWIAVLYQMYYTLIKYDTSYVAGLPLIAVSYVAE